MTHRGLRAFLIFILTLSAAVCLVLGLTMPVMRLTRLYFWTDTHSVLSIISALYATDETFLASVIFIFSLVFPSIKLLYITMAGTLITFDPARRSRWFRRIEWLGKWSMLDVLVLALLVFYAKSMELADAVALPGIYFFAASVILTMVAYSLVDPDAAWPKREELSKAGVSSAQSSSQGERVTALSAAEFQGGDESPGQRV